MQFVLFLGFIFNFNEFTFLLANRDYFDLRMSENEHYPKSKEQKTRSLQIGCLAIETIDCLTYQRSVPSNIAALPFR
jgi:hypothetical protein